MNGLSLFSGAGIGELAFKLIFKDYNYRTVGYVEWDKYCQQVIRARIRDGILDDAPIFGDIREFNAEYAESYAGKVDWLSGGFPCQPFSVAGRQLGEADERNMWPATRDAISIIRPRYAILENVPGALTSGYIYTVFAELTAIGLCAGWDTLQAAAVGAPTLRDRLWFLTDGGPVDGERRYPPQSPTQCSQAEGDCGQTEEWSADWYVARMVPGVPIRSAADWWGNQSRMARSSHGVAHRVDRLKALGNGWVPQVVAAILNVHSAA